MNSSFILEMVAARASASGNTAVVDALARLRSTSGELSAEKTQDLITQLGQNNPAVSAWVRHMSESQAAQPVREPIVIDAEAVAPPVEAWLPPSVEDPAGGTIDAVNELREHAQNMFAELQILRQRSDHLAAALGACCLCWGEDANCRNCHGRGAAGFSLPHEAQFDQFVLPAIRMLKAQMSAFELRARRANRAADATEPVRAPD